MFDGDVYVVLAHAIVIDDEAVRMSVREPAGLRVA